MNELTITAEALRISLHSGTGAETSGHSWRKLMGFSRRCIFFVPQKRENLHTRPEDAQVHEETEVWHDERPARKSKICVEDISCDGYQKQYVCECYPKFARRTKK